MSYECSYLEDVLNPEKSRKVLKAFVQFIKDSELEFDTVVCRGTSGLLVAPYVCQELGKHLIVIRKDYQNHSGLPLEGYKESRKYIIVDDIIFTGYTIEVQYNTMKKYRESALLVGIFCYRNIGWRIGFRIDGGPKFNGEELRTPVWSMIPEYDTNCDKMIYYLPDKDVIKIYGSYIRSHA